MIVIRFNREIIVLIFCMILIQVVLYIWFGGIRFGGDSPRYISAAEELIQVRLGELSLKQSMMISYIYFIALHMAIFNNLGSVVFSQCVIFTATSVLLWLVFRDYCSRVSAWLLIFTYFCFFFLIRFNFYILSDSLAIAGSALVAWLLHELYTKEDFNLIPYTPLLLFFSLVRPNLMLIVLSFFVVAGLFKLKSKEQLGRSFMVVGIMIATLTVLLVYQYNRYLDEVFMELIRHLESGTIYTPVRVEMPQAEYINAPAISLFYYIFDNFIAVARLFILRILGYLAMVRPIFSLWTNLYLVLYGIFIYSLSFIGLTSKRCRNIKIAVIVLISSNLIFIGFTYGASDSRYVMFIMPFLWVLMSIGMGKLEQSGFFKIIKLPSLLKSFKYSRS